MPPLTCPVRCRWPGSTPVRAIRAIRVAPPLILSADQAEEFTAALPGILDAAERA